MRKLKKNSKNSKIKELRIRFIFINSRHSINILVTYSKNTLQKYEGKNSTKNSKFKNEAKSEKIFKEKNTSMFTQQTILRDCEQVQIHF